MSEKEGRLEKSKLGKQIVQLLILRNLIFLKVRKSNSSTSVVNLQSAVDKTMSQLKEQGLLSGEALGQIFTSVSDMLNAEAGQDQKDEKRKVNDG